MMHPTPFSLALDIAGPFKTKGRDFDESKYKYLLAGAYRIPAQLLKDAKVEEEVVPEDTPPEGTAAKIQTHWSRTKALAPLPLMTYQTSQSCLGKKEVRSQKKIQERQMKDQAMQRMI